MGFPQVVVLSGSGPGFALLIGMLIRSIILACFGVLILLYPSVHAASPPPVGMWVCKDTGDHTVFTNRVTQYQNCRPYVSGQSLRDALDKQMRIREKEDTSLAKILDNARSSGKILGPL
jgi:hypothetical protein